MKRFKCTCCDVVVLRAGGTSRFRCDVCRPVLSPHRQAQLAAHKAVAQAIRAGALAAARGQRCADCGGTATEYDHRDYSKALDVDPVCRRCNLERGPAIGSPAQRFGAFARIAQQLTR